MFGGKETHEGEGEAPAKTQNPKPPFRPVKDDTKPFLRDPVQFHSFFIPFSHIHMHLMHILLVFNWCCRYLALILSRPSKQCSGFLPLINLSSTLNNLVLCFFLFRFFSLFFGLTISIMIHLIVVLQNMMC